MVVLFSLLVIIYFVFFSIFLSCNSISLVKYICFCNKFIAMYEIYVCVYVCIIICAYVC